MGYDGLFILELVSIPDFSISNLVVQKSVFSQIDDVVVCVVEEDRTATASGIT